MWNSVRGSQSGHESNEEVFGLIWGDIVILNSQEGWVADD
jgi:hypothetical protein